MTKSKTRPTTKSIYDGLCDGYDALDDEVLSRLERVDAKVTREDNSFSYEYWGCRGVHSEVSYDVEVVGGNNTEFSITQVYREPLDEDEMDLSKWDPIYDMDDRSAVKPVAKLIDLTQVENEDGTFTLTYSFEVEVEIDDDRLEREYEESRYDYERDRYDD